MLQCWDANPDERPPFSKLATDIDEKLTGMAGYLDFNKFDLITSSSAENLSSSVSWKEWLSCAYYEYVINDKVVYSVKMFVMSV